jgi:hypothetical protein
LISDYTLLNLSIDLETKTKLKPHFANSMAKLLPIPSDAPVIIAHFLSYGLYKSFNLSL